MTYECNLIISNLAPGLTERGKIKIGEKGRFIKSAQGKEFQPPKKLDYFRVTTLERGPDGNYLPDHAVHKLYGDRPRELPVRLLYDEVELNFQCRYTCFVGRTLWCFGDGEKAYRLPARGAAGAKRDRIPCPCERQDPVYPGSDRCKINACLSVIIDGVDTVGGVWKLRTTSYNSTVGILSSLALIKRLTGGPLAGIPLVLTLQPKTVIVPTTGQSMQVWVVGLEFRGKIEQLQQIAYQQAERFAIHQVKIEKIEEQARRLIAAGSVAEIEAEADDVVEEFFPEQVTAEKGREVDNGADIGGDQEGGAREASEARAAGYPDVSAQRGDGPAPDPAPAAAPGGGAPDQQAKRRRSRRNRFEVDENIFGVREILTCGATPEQILKLRDIGKRDPDGHEKIRAYMESIGYEQLSFLREDEASELLSAVEKKSPTEAPASPDGLNDPAQAQAPAAGAEGPDDLVECEIRGGDKMSRSAYCLTRCPDREKNGGWCPILGETPPAKEGLI